MNQAEVKNSINEIESLLLKKNVEIANKLASNEGWYISGEFTHSQINYIFNMYEQNNDINEINGIIKRFINESELVKLIEFSLIKDNPTRERFIKEGICAHNEQKYSLSILSFLQQADGIAYKYMSKNMFHDFKQKKFDEFISSAIKYDNTKKDIFLKMNCGHNYWPLYPSLPTWF